MPVFDNILQAIGRTPLVHLHKLVGPNDAVVYATALAHECDLVTGDADFEGLPGVIYVPKRGKPGPR